jgi:hypothetical protein
MATAASSEAGGIRAWHLFLVVGLVGASAATALSRDTRPESLIMVSLTVLSVIAAGIAFHRTLQPLGANKSGEEAVVLSARARAALEREKMLVLRTIKELEFDRAMGKIADVDFQEMVGRLRARAIGILRQLDMEADGYRGLIERELASRLQQAGVEDTVSPAPKSRAGQGSVPTALACTACGATNDDDARFCKQCGAKLDAFAVSV